MIYITGDTHGKFGRRFNTKAFPEQKKMTKEDYLIVCGDYGGIWDLDGESKEEKNWLKWFDTRNYTLLFVDGNHENFNRLYSYPEKEWNGGRVHEIRPNILHLMRGQIFELCGKKIFTFGGAQSHDIAYGILDRDDPKFNEKKKSLNKDKKFYRIKNESWWEQELPSAEEMDEGLKNLEAHSWNVDFIITHCCATSTQELINEWRIQELKKEGRYTPNILTDYLEEIKNRTQYNMWFFGHYHDIKIVNDNEEMIYEQIIQIT